MGASLHLAMLRSAAVLVPAMQRADWLEEWRSELWHVQRDPRGQNVTAFCSGAFRDAFWLWRNDPYPDRYSAITESPALCLAMLAGLGAFCLAVALLLPGSRTVLLSSLYSRDLVMLTAAGQGDAYVHNGFIEPKPSVSREQFESLKSGGRFSGLAFYVPVRLRVETPNGARMLLVAKTTADLFGLLKIPLHAGHSGQPVLVLSRSTLRRYFRGDVRNAGPEADVFADRRWNLPGRVDAWVIEDEAALAALPGSTEGFVAGRLRDDTLSDGRFRFIRLADRSFELLGILPPMFLLVCMAISIMSFGSRRGHLGRIGARRALFFAAKVVLVLQIVMFGSLALGSLGGSVSPLYFDIAVFGSVAGVRWIVADQRRRCPVCLKRLANPVRMGEWSRILLEWHGTELMCPRGHGLLYVPEWPAIWSRRQRWMELGASWGGMFP